VLWDEDMDIDETVKMIEDEIADKKII